MTAQVAGAQLGVVTEDGEIEAHTAPFEVRAGGREITDDYFVRRDGVEFAGTHLLVELWQSEGLDDLARVEQTLTEAVAACDATLLNLFLHHFGPEQGVSGVAVLAESHISIHTWPERGYAAIDIFMCGLCDPYKAIPVFKRMLAPGSVQLTEAKRGLIP